MVFSPSTSSAAISAFERPRATRRSTSTSRSVSSESAAGIPWPRLRGTGELLDQAPGDRRSDQRVAGRGHAHRIEQPCGRGVLEQEAAGADAQGLVDVVSDVERREHHDGGGSAPSPMISSAARRPSSSGMRMSMSTTSGRRAASGRRPRGRRRPRRRPRCPARSRGSRGSPCARAAGRRRSARRSARPAAASPVAGANRGQSTSATPSGALTPGTRSAPAGGFASPGARTGDVPDGPGHQDPAIFCGGAEAARHDRGQALAIVAARRRLARVDADPQPGRPPGRRERALHRRRHTARPDGAAEGDREPGVGGRAASRPPCSGGLALQQIDAFAARRLGGVGRAFGDQDGDERLVHAHIIAAAVPALLIPQGERGRSGSFAPIYAPPMWLVPLLVAGLAGHRRGGAGSAGRKGRDPCADRPGHGQLLHGQLRRVPASSGRCARAGCVAASSRRTCERIRSGRCRCSPGRSTTSSSSRSTTWTRSRRWRRRFPKARFALFDAPLSILGGPTRNVQAMVIQPLEAAYLAGWLAARMERLRPGKDVVGAVGGVDIPPVNDFIVGFRAGARAADPGVTVPHGIFGRFPRREQVRGNRTEPDRARRRCRVQRGGAVRSGDAARRQGRGACGVSESTPTSRSSALMS